MDDPLLQRYGREFSRGTVLFRQGEPGNEMYVLQKGRVTISKKVGDVETILTTLGPGEFLGEMSILCQRPRSATATVAEDARLLVLDGKTFENMIRASPEIALRMIRKLAERLQVADDRISALGLRDASSRVVHHLASAADRAARDPGAVVLAHARDELPGLLGLSPERVEEVLDKLTRAGLVIARGEEGLEIPDPAKLRHFLDFLLLRSQFEGTA